MGNHIVKCRRCGETISAKRGDYLLRKKIDHKKACHPGFEDILHDPS